MIEYRNGKDYVFFNDVELTPENAITLTGIDFMECIDYEGKLVILGYLNREEDSFVILVDAENVADAIILYLQAYIYNQDDIYKLNETSCGFEWIESNQDKKTITLTDDFIEDLRCVKLLKDYPHVNALLVKQIITEIDTYNE
jgi:hypothetical protein